MKPNPIQPVWRPSFVRSLSVVVAAAVAAVGLPAHAVALEPAPTVSAAPTSEPTAGHSPAQATTTEPAGTAVAQMSSPAAPTKTSPVDLKRLQDEIGANGASMGQGLKSKQTGSPRSGKTESFSEMMQIENTWQAPGIQGLDVSSHQPTVDWPAQYSMGARFAYVKASEGLTYRSPTFNSQYSGAQSVGMLRGAYHFALPSISTGAAQADYFVNSGGGWSPDGKTMPPLLDIEYNPYSSLGNTCYNMSASAMVNWIKDFSNRILARTGRLPMIYTTTDWWTQCTGNSGAFGNHPLHLASYSTYVGNMPNGWGTYSVWQYSSTGPFAGDSNAWNGSYAGLQKFASTADGAIPNPSIKSTGDVVAADASGALWDYPATGTGDFGTRRQIGHGWTGLRSINVIDWNADGVLDIVAQWTSGRVNIYIGKAAGGFTAGPVLASSGWGGYQLTIGYWLSASYYPQILTRDDAGSLTLWQNSSGSGLGTSTRIGTGWGGLNLTMVDFDGDGNEDILAQDKAGTLRQYRSNGSGAFISELRPTVGSGWHQMTSVTVTFAFKGNTNTGLMARARDGRLIYYPVPGNSSWGAPASIGTGWNGYLIAGGETVNLTVAPTPSLSSSSDIVTINEAGELYRHATGSGSVGNGAKIGDGFTGAISVHVVDWNADRVLDVATLSQTGTFAVRLGQASGGFGDPTTVASGLSGSEVVPGHWIRGSKYPGVLERRSDGVLRYYANSSGGRLEPAVKIGHGFTRMHVVMIDADGDGNQDVGAVNYLGRMSLFRSNGAGSFISESRKSLGTGWNSMTSISAVKEFAEDSSSGILARDAGGTLNYYPLSASAFGQKSILSSGWASSLISGSPLLAAERPISSMADVLSVDSGGNLWNHAVTSTKLSPPYQIGTGWGGMKSVRVVDWNNDAVADVLAEHSSGALIVYFGSDSGGFTAPIKVTSAEFNASTFLAGKWVSSSKFPGVVGYGTDGELKYWANSSGNTLSAPIRIGVGWGGLKLAMIDFDSDGAQDLLAVDNSGYMKLYRSTGSSKFVGEARKVVGSGWQGFRQFSANAGFAGPATKGVLALQTTGDLRYYPVTAYSKWGQASSAGTISKALLVSSTSAAN